MSYAAVAAHNAPPPSEQPHASTDLLNTTPPTAGNAMDDTAKVNLVSPNYKAHPATFTSEANIRYGDDEDSPPGNPDKRKRENKRSQEAGAEGLYIWEVAKHYLLQPGVAGGLVGLLNVGLLATAGRALYLQPSLRRDKNIILSVAAATIALFSVEGYAAEKYRKTPRGQAEERRAKKEGTVIYKHLHEQILRPGVLSGMVGLLNTAILGTVGYISYMKWDKPTWDRRTVFAVTGGLLAMWGGEGLIVEHYRKRGH